MYDTSHFVRAKASATCPCCGAPIITDICDYCGSTLVDIACIKTHEPTLLKIIDEAGIVRVMNVTLRELREETDEPTLFWADDKVYLTNREAHLIMSFDFV